MIRRALLVVALLASPAMAADLYFGPTSAGANSGTNCANAYAYNDGTHGWSLSAQQVAGNNLHICPGTYTVAANAVMMTFVNSGTSGNPITLIADQGAATFQSPYFSNTTGAITNTGSLSYVTVNGDNNLTIQNTANGTLQANQQTSVGVYFSNCTHCSVRNTTIQNIYLNNGSGSGATDILGQYTAGISLNGASTGCVITGNILASAKDGVIVDADANADASNCTIANNTISDTDHGIEVGGGDSGDTITGLVIHDNSITNWTNWQFPTASYHTDGVILYNFASGSATNVATLYNNHIYGNLGTGSPTAFIYCAQNSKCTLYNNWLINTGSNIDGILWLDTHQGGYLVYQNTIVGNNSNDICVTLGTSTSTTFPNTPLILENNIFINCYVTYNDYSTLVSDIGTSDHNVQVNFGGGAPQMFTGGSTFLSYATWQGDGFDAHSSTSSPNLNGSYVPQPTSSAIGLGANLYSTLAGNVLNTDAAGNSRGGGSCTPVLHTPGCWDAGAFMYSSGVLPPQLMLLGVGNE